MIKKFLILIACCLCLSSIKAEAKWWIFGQGNDEVNINYLYLNQNSYDESGNKVILYKDALKNDSVVITGKASVRTGKIGAVLISKDNKESWEKAKLNENGTFQYNFTPELGKNYDLFIKIIDTAGKNNDIEATHKTLTVIDENISQIIRDTLNKILNSYQNEEANLFMSYVSPEFTGDEATLDTAIRKDFNAFDLIKINYYINNISKDSSGKVFLSLQYNRTVVSTKTGQTYTDNGNTEIVFKNESGNFKIYSMKNPLIFGLSDAANVATGTIQATNNDPILLVDETGNITEEPFREAINTIENGDDGDDEQSATVQTATITDGDFFNIKTGTNTAGNNSFTMEANQLHGQFHVYFNKIVGAASINSVNSVDSFASDVDHIVVFPINIGDVYAVKFEDCTYGVMEITAFTSADHTSFKYKYPVNLN